MRAAVCVLCQLALAGTATAQQARTTGSRLAEGLSPRSVMSFADPGEVRRVLELIEAGDVDGAVALAESYLATLASARDVDGASSTQKRYLALNAHCIALTKAGRLDEAHASCSSAIALIPERWTAHNSRGAVRYSQQRYTEALDDYRRALDVAPPQATNVRAAIEQNIRLAQARLDAR